jgi:hypothetical protein
MVSVIAVRHKVRGFKPDAFVRAVKVLNMTSFGGEVLLSVPCRNILRHVGSTLQV